MKLPRQLVSAARTHRRRASTLTALIALLSSGLLLPVNAALAATAVPLGTAYGFAVLAGSTITNTGPSVVSGHMGLHPGTDTPGYPDITHNGALNVADGVALQAKNDLTGAFTNAAGQLPSTEIPAELGGSILVAGAYTSVDTSFGITGVLTLDAEGDSSAVFVFKMGSTLTTASGSNVSLINGASVCNVFWQVGSSATLGSGSTIRGTVMADQSITLNTGAAVQGRVQARIGAVTMDNNVISNAACFTPPAADGEQVTGVPTGGVATGDGPVDTSPTLMSVLFIAVLTLVAVGSAVGVTTRRRDRASDPDHA